MRLLACLLLALWAPAAFAQTAAEIAAERQRIAAERARVDAQFNARKAECYQKFAVSGCVAEAQAEQRQALSDLRRQEVGLNDAERRRKAGDRLRELEERQSAHREEQRERARAKALADSQDREQRAQDKADKAAKVPQAAASREERGVRGVDTDGNARRHAERAAEAKEHRAKVLEREGKRQNRAQPLPVPP